MKGLRFKIQVEHSTSLEKHIKHLIRLKKHITHTTNFEKHIKHFISLHKHIKYPTNLEFLKDGYNPSITFILFTKRPHTRLFSLDSEIKVPPGSNLYFFCLYTMCL